MHNGLVEVGNPLEWSLEFKAAWARYMIAECRSLAARKAGNLARVLGPALPGESREELERMVQEDGRLAQEGLLRLMNEQGETYHKHVDELRPGDIADRLRAETALNDWLMCRAEQLFGLFRA